MRKRGFVLVTLIAFLNATTGWAFTDRFLLPTDPGTGRLITEVCVKTGFGYSARTKCQKFDQEGGTIDPDAELVYGVTGDGKKLELPIAEVVGVKIATSLKEKYRQDQLRLDAINEGTAWQPEGSIRRLVLLSGETIEFQDVATDLDLEKMMVSWNDFDNTAVEVPLSSVYCLEFTGDRQTGQMGRVAQVSFVSGEIWEFPDALPALDLDARELRWTRSGEQVELSFAELADLSISSDKKIVLGSWDQATAGIRAEEIVRVVSPGGRDTSGLFASRTSTQISLLSDEELIELAAGEVEQIWVQVPSTQNGVIVGGVVGFLAGAALGAAFADPFGGDDSAANNVEGALAGGLLVGFFSAVVGGAIGSTIPHWQLHYDAGQSP